MLPKSPKELPKESEERKSAVAQMKRYRLVKRSLQRVKRKLADVTI